MIIIFGELERHVNFFINSNLIPSQHGRNPQPGGAVSDDSIVYGLPLSFIEFLPLEAVPSGKGYAFAKTRPVLIDRLENIVAQVENG